jgi:hypothetical protein
LILNVGVKRKFLETSERSTYSSKTSSIVLLLKFVVPFGGEAFKSLGGSESLGPPEGGTIFAHDEPVTESRNAKDKMRIVPATNFIQANISLLF